jgi:hypothetical protein
MRSKVSTLFLVVLLGTGAACGRAENLETDVINRITRAQAGSLEYLYSEETQSQEVKVRGRIEDSVRHAEILMVDGESVMERVVHDDVLAIQVKVPDRIPQLSTPEPADLAVAEALRVGRWVIDPSGAPAEGSAGETVEIVGADPLRDAANVFQYARLSLGQAAAVIRFNPDAIEYLPEEDPFPQPNEQIQEERFDLLPPPLPRREGETLPGPASFRKMAVYTIRNRVVRILEQIDIESQTEIKRARQTGRNRFLLRLAEEVKRGRTDQKIRERHMSFEILSQGEALRVPVPNEGFIGNLRVLFGEKKEEEGIPSQAEPPVVPVPPSP